MIGWALYDVHGDVAIFATAPQYSVADMGCLLWMGLFTTGAVRWGETKLHDMLVSTARVSGAQGAF